MAKKVFDIFLKKSEIQGDATAPGIRAHASKKFFCHISQAELACRICEAVLDIERPAGGTAEHLLDAMDEESRRTWLAAADAAMDYLKECIMNSSEPH